MMQAEKTVDLSKPIILFDGVCNFCNSSINTIIKLDPKGKIRFASLQSELGQKLLKQFNLSTNEMDSVVLINGQHWYKQSDVAFELFKILGGAWYLLYIFKIVPRFIRDSIYDWIARNRYKWFGKQEACMIPTPEVRERFLST